MAKKLQITSAWTTLEDRPVTKESLKQLFENEVPCLRHPRFLSAEECQRMVKVVETTKFGHYDPELIFPLVGTIGITQFDYAKGKFQSLRHMNKYFSLVESARSLQCRLIEEAGVDIVARVMALLGEVSGLPVRMAREDDRDYFAGILRVVEGNYIAPHADYGPFDDPEHEIGAIVGQISWNVLLKQVPGGDTLIHDHQWQGKPDNEKFQKTAPKYAYSPLIYQGRIPKVMPAIEGDLTFFNSRNIHEVKSVDEWNGKTEHDKRYTMSSFVGYLPEEARGPCLILWS
ncbi:hypothetical protein F5Y06DRAFT_296546 [Hypoxylon sp. FL0890]|nr:hypothetical protein F5Y06DRAFT_296546 [Hypoxylon sp. FL0890]